jgi:hypothetical protein
MDHQQEIAQILSESHQAFAPTIGKQTEFVKSAPVLSQ